MNRKAKQVISILAFLFLAMPLFSQFYVENGGKFSLGNYQRILGDETTRVDVVVFEDLSSVSAVAKLFYKTDREATFTWYKINYDVNPPKKEMLPESIVSNSTTSSISNLEKGTYLIEIDTTSQNSNDFFEKHISIVDNVDYPIQISSFSIIDSEEGMNPCESIKLKAEAASEQVLVYDYALKTSIVIPREIKFIWSEMPKTNGSWSEISSVALPSNIKALEAPFQDKDYKVEAASYYFNNSIAYGNAELVKSYEAVAVKYDGIEGVVTERENNNEVDKVDAGGDIKGSSPLDVVFNPKNKTDKVLYYQWEIWKNEGDNPAIIKYNSEEANHRFIYPLENKQSDQTADYIAKLTVSNDICEYVDSTEVFLVNSYLRAPNIFVIGFGLTIQYKCEYKSILPGSFKGVIINRWGRTVHKWTDPQLGWDGRIGSRYVSPGPYRVVMEAKGTDGRNLRFRSDLTILREK